MSQDGEHGYFMRSASDVCGQLTRAVPPTRLLCASQPRCTRISFWVVMIYFWFVKTLRRLHYQLLSPMSFMNLCHLGLTRVLRAGKTNADADLVSENSHVTHDLVPHETHAEMRQSLQCSRPASLYTRAGPGPLPRKLSQFLCTCAQPLLAGRGGGARHKPSSAPRAPRGP